jgi:hypothetical protein
MPVNGYTVGRDVVLRVIRGDGTVLAIPGLTNFRKKPDMSDHKVVKIDGNVDHLVFPGGWSGSFELDRTDASIDNFMAEFEANYYAGQNVLPGTISESITEANGSVSQYKYIGVVLKPTDMGEAAGDKTVKQTLEFMASRRVKGN